MIRYLGVDPGQSGGFAIVDESGTLRLAWKMPATEHDIIDTLARALADHGPLRAAIEQVHSSPQMGVRSAFTFGRGVGGLTMALVALRVPFEEVSPIKWQTGLNCRSRGDKNVTKRKAQYLWPDHRMTHALADAALIAEWLRRREVICGTTGQA